MYHQIFPTNSLPVLLLALCFLCMGIVSCQKEGCKDINGVNYNANADVHDGLCTYRYLNEVTLVRVPFTRPGGVNWDNPNVDPITYPEEEYPELKFYLKRKESTYWEYQTAIAFDAKSTPITWNIKDFGSNYLLMHAEYEFKLVDEDEKSEEQIFQGSFVPADVLQDNLIHLQDQNLSTSIELHYIIN